MKTEYNYKHKITFEDIMFWIIIAGMIGIALWMISGSPTEMGAIIGIVTFAAASDTLIWKSLFKMDKKTAIGFLKTKHDLDLIENNINNRFDNINNKLNNIEKLIKK
ncbi:MAG: hypothetical protein AABW67_00250 [Nanoarchaeota archaeon]